jgi:glyceraldehyde-3-phosphate dehydrogenase/erythrose-4-phosphate dehydrogenase
MGMKVAINGFGQIDGLAFCAVVASRQLGNDIEAIALNNLVRVENLADLIQYDSTQGHSGSEVRAAVKMLWSLMSTKSGILWQNMIRCHCLGTT